MKQTGRQGQMHMAFAEASICPEGVSLNSFFDNAAIVFQVIVQTGQFLNLLFILTSLSQYV